MSTTQLTPDSLARTLLNYNHGLEQLLDDLATDAESLAHTLYSLEFQDHLKLRVDLAIAQARLQAADALPACAAKLLLLTDAEKPEVARRAIMAVMGMAGLATRVAPVPATSTDDQLDDDETEDASDDLNPFEKHRLFEEEQRRLKDEQEFRALKEIDHRFKQAGIDLTQLREQNFNGFLQHLQSFFTPAGIHFNNTPPFEWHTSPHNPEARARAHDYFNQNSPNSTPIDPQNINETPQNAALSAPTATSTPVPPT